jgi:hypothetical protein
MLILCTENNNKNIELRIPGQMLYVIKYIIQKTSPLIRNRDRAQFCCMSQQVKNIAHAGK